MLIGQISDLHVKIGGKLAYGVVDTAKMLGDCVTHMMSLNTLPDVLLVTGDLVDYGQPAEYELVKELLSPLRMPVYLAVGNHDDRTALRAVFSGPGFEYLVPCDEFVQYTVNMGEIRLVMLDTTIPKMGGGELCSKRLKWLDERLGEDQTPTVIAMHHPPFATGLAYMDAIGLQDSKDLESIVSRHNHVERLLCGHIHRSIQSRFGNTFASTCPSPAHQIALDLTVEGSGCFAMEPPGYQLHLWHQGRLVSHTCAIGNFGGPYPFRKDGVLID